MSKQNILIKKRLLKINYAILIFMIVLFFAPITKVYSLFENDPELSTKELLFEIRSSCLQNTGKTPDNVAMALPAFSALLVRLSNEASNTADKNITIQNRMIILTSIILVISIAQLVLGFLHFSSKSAVQPERTVTAPKSKNPEKEL